MERYRAIIEAAGAEFCGVRADSVYFRDPETGANLSLYLWACDSQNVRLALKASRDRVRDFPQLEPTEAAFWRPIERRERRGASYPLVFFLRRC